MKIFCIGLNKTATVSLHRALTILGYDSLHWGGPETRARVVRAMREEKPLLTYLEDHDAYSDIQVITNNFDSVDEQYPGSKFILTTRRMSDWLDSRKRHVEKNQQRRKAGTYHGDFLEVDLEMWAAEYQAHHGRVRAYFAGRHDDLLELDITAGDGWEPLCSFLDRPVPDEPFPVENRYQPFTASAGDDEPSSLR